MPTFEELRTLAITALFADDQLFEYLVLKGGNALGLVHRIQGRSSIDLDFSIASDFDEKIDPAALVKAALVARFGAAGYSVFDFRFERRPSGSTQTDRWGGYQADFKITSHPTPEQLGNLAPMTALDVGPGFQKKMTIQISHHEHVTGAIEMEIDNHSVVVYTPTMIAAEKLRAICQQLPSYPHTRHPRARSRDFYDIYQVCAVAGHRLDTPESKQLMGLMFDAKEVPLSLLDQVASSREFHRADWSSVEQSTTTPPKAFDFYFDYVLELIKSLRNE